jgi:hypothetical protein
MSVQIAVLTKAVQAMTIPFMTTARVLWMRTSGLEPGVRKSLWPLCVYGRPTGWFFERLLSEEIEMRFLKLPVPKLPINGWKPFCTRPAWRHRLLGRAPTQAAIP